MPQQVGNIGPDDEGALGAAPDIELAVGVPKGGSVVGFNVALMHRGGFVLPLQYQVGLGKALRRVALLECHPGGDVAGLVGELAQLGGEQVGMEQGGVGLHRFPHGHRRGQDFVVHPD